MGNVLGLDVGLDLPDITTSIFGGTFTVILILIIVAVAIGIGLFVFMRYRTFNRQVILFENIAGQGYQVTYKDRARLVKIGDGGEELLYLMKKKVFRTAYGKKMGKNTYWFAVGQDGYWYNILLGDLDAKMGMLDIEPVDRDMRYMHVAIRKNITERYRKIGFMEKYGSLVINGVFLIIMLIGLWLLVDQIGELMGQATEVVRATEQSLETISQALSKVDSICSGGSGITPVS